MRNQNRALVCAAATAAVAAMAGTHLSAAELYWKGGVGNLLDPNYTSDGSDTIPYTPGDIVHLGANGSITVNTPINYSAVPPTAPGSVHVGHNFGTLPGPATLTVAGSGSSLVLVGNPTATNLFDRAGLVVGYNADGSYVNTTNSNMDGLVIIGGDNPDDAVTGTGTGTLTVNGGNFRVRKSDFIIGYGNRGVLNHGAGHLMVGMHNQASVSNDAYDMYLGYTTASEWNKTFRGRHFIGNSLFIGSGSLVNLEAGLTATKHKTVDNGYATDAPEGDVVVGRNGSVNDRLNISYNGTPTSGFDIGPTELRVGNRFLLASGGGGATTSTVNQSDGTVIVARNLSVSDTGNTSTATYNLSGGTLTANADLSRIGRRGNGQMIQTGGTATFNAGLAIGDDDSTAPGETDNATGLYEISGGTLTTNLAGDALRLGSAGKGTLRVVGQGGAINVNGNLTSSNTSDGAGKLAYKFEAGESLSTVNVTGTATFAFNSGLAIDSSAIPTPASGTTYNLVSAADVTDNGLLLTDWGWTHQVVPNGAGGEFLQAVKTTPQYWDTDGTNPGAGGAAPSGAWNGTAANFSTDSTGSSATGATTGVFDDVVFAAGSDGTGSYTVTVSGTQTAHGVQFARGNVLLSGGTLAVGHFDAVSGATGTVSSNIAGDAFGRVIKSGVGTITLASANSYAGGTTVSGGTLVLGNADATGGGSINVADGALVQAQASLPKALTVTTLATNASGKFDLTDNKLVVTTTPIGSWDGSAYTGVSGLVDSARGNAGAPLWDGSGITTSDPRAQGSNLVSIGVAKAGDVKGIADTDTATFAGQTVLGSDTIAMVTYGGDATLDGKINIDDYGRIDANVAQSGSVFGWYNGDFNYDGAINIDDYGIIDGNISSQGTAFPTAAAAGAAEGVSAVPEPASLSVLALGAMGLMRRRRQR